jgi:leucyl/phenylalanyl-tRNA---protein transferase
MPVYLLKKEIVFPHPSLADQSGLLAAGGDLAPERIILAYKNGIFPWYNKDEPILWWSPNPRCVMFPNKFKVSKSLKLLIAKKSLEVRFDTNFNKVIACCAKVHEKRDSGTWITDEMKKAYVLLHKLGYAHSVETYLNNKLVGGLYGIAIGKVFYGESMFYVVPNASKVAFYYLIERLKKWKFEIIDNQTYSGHLESLGSELIDRNSFLKIIKKSSSKKFQINNWQG